MGGENSGGSGGTQRLKNLKATRIVTAFFAGRALLATCLFSV